MSTRPNLTSQYAEIYYVGAGSDIIMPEQDVWYQFLGFDGSGVYNGAAPDLVEKHILIAVSGIYKICAHYATRCATLETFQASIRKNNGAEISIAAMSHDVKTVTNTLQGTMLTTLCQLNTGDSIELWALRTTGGAVSKTLTFEHAILSMILTSVD